MSLWFEARQDRQHLYWYTWEKFFSLCCWLSHYLGSHYILVSCHPLEVFFTEDLWKIVLVCTELYVLLLTCWILICWDSGFNFSSFIDFCLFWMLFGLLFLTNVLLYPLFFFIYHIYLSHCLSHFWDYAIHAHWLIMLHYMYIECMLFSLCERY